MILSVSSMSCCNYITGRNNNNNDDDDDEDDDDDDDDDNNNNNNDFIEVSMGFCIVANWGQLK